MMMKEFDEIFPELMARVEVKDYLDFSRKSGVAEWQFYRLEHGLIDNIPWGILKKIALTLDIDVLTLISCFDNSVKDSSLKKEDNGEDYQEQIFHILESLLLQLPTIAHAVKNNPDLPASRLLPLLEPLNSLLAFWQVDAIGTVGEIVDYNPQEHELMNNHDNLDRPEKVQIRYVGYRQGDKLLHRAKVSSL